MRNIKNILTNEIKLNMKPFQIEIPDGKEAKWVDGVLTLVDEKPIEYKFKVGDKVIIYAGLEHLNFPTRKLIRAILARHVCELLNREHSEKGGEE